MEFSLIQKKQKKIQNCVDLNLVSQDGSCQLGDSQQIQQELINTMCASVQTNQQESYSIDKEKNIQPQEMVLSFFFEGFSKGFLQFVSEDTLNLIQALISSKLIQQQLNYKFWEAQDKYKLGISNSADFRLPKSEEEIFLFRYNALYSYHIGSQVYLKVDNEDEWARVAKQNIKIALGFNISNKILYSESCLNLRVNCYKLSFSIQLYGKVNFTVLLRSNINLNNPEAVALQFVKDSTRVHLIAGTLDPRGQQKLIKDFVFIKKCEIPVLNHNEITTKYDFLELQVTILDFGNEKLKLRIDTNKSQNGLIQCLDNNFIPYFEDHFVYFIGIGTEIYLQNVEIEIFSRNMADKYNQELHEKRFEMKNKYQDDDQVIQQCKCGLNFLKTK